MLPGLKHMILVDGFDADSRKFIGWQPFNKLYYLLITFLFAKFKNVTFKTGVAAAHTPTSLLGCLDSVAKDSPVFLLDSVTRPPILKGVTLDERVRFAQMNHVPVSRRVWMSEAAFERLWGDVAGEKKRESVRIFCGTNERRC